MIRKGKLILSWLGMYVLCTIFGFIDTDNSLLKAIFALFSMGFHPKPHKPLKRLDRNF